MRQTDTLDEAIEVIGTQVGESTAGGRKAFSLISSFAIKANKHLPDAFDIHYQTGWCGQKTGRKPTMICFYLYRNREMTKRDHYHLQPGHRPWYVRWTLDEPAGKWKNAGVNHCTAEEFAGALARRVEHMMRQQSEPNATMEAIAKRICKPIIYVCQCGENYKARLACDPKGHHFQEGGSLDPEMSIAGVLRYARSAGYPADRNSYTAVLVGEEEFDE